MIELSWNGNEMKRANLVDSTGLSYGSRMGSVWRAC